MRITVRENEPPVEARDIASVDEVISSAGEEARAKGVLNVVFIEAESGNYLTLVVGGDETALGFNYAHQGPPYYASKGMDERDEPVMTAFLALEHHTEFLRRWVVPMEVGVSAVGEFCETGDLPKSIEWMEM